MSNQIVTFLDTVGRTIIGETFTEQTTVDVLAIKNPAVVHIVPNPQTNQLQLQILPLFFREFQADKTEAIVWLFKRNNITENAGFTLDFKLVAQYQQATTPQQSAPQQAPGEPDTIKLFDEE